MIQTLKMPVKVSPKRKKSETAGSASNDDNDKARKRHKKKVKSEHSGDVSEKKVADIAVSVENRAGTDDSGNENNDTSMKVMLRREANRIHAFKSRQRSKLLLTELQQTVTQLTEEKTELERRNAVLTAQVEVLQQQNLALVRSQGQQVMGDAATQSVQLQQVTQATDSNGSSVQGGLNSFLEQQLLMFQQLQPGLKPQQQDSTSHVNATAFTTSDTAQASSVATSVVPTAPHLTSTGPNGFPSQGNMPALGSLAGVQVDPVLLSLIMSGQFQPLLGNALMSAIAQHAQQTGQSTSVQNQDTTRAQTVENHEKQDQQHAKQQSNQESISEENAV